MSPCWTLLLVRGLCAPSVLSPDWNQTQVSCSSARCPASSLQHGDNCVCEGVLPPTLHLMCRYMASTPALATSHSRAPAPTAARHAQPPTSAVAAPSLITWGGGSYR